jgi:hypothetical protein
MCSKPRLIVLSLQEGVEHMQRRVHFEPLSVGVDDRVCGARRVRDRQRRLSGPQRSCPG